MARRLYVVALQVLLTGLGGAMALASRRVDRMRRQITRDLCIELRSADGARQAYRLQAHTRRLTLVGRGDVSVDCSLEFDTASRGLRTLLSRRRIGRIVEGVNAGQMEIDGNPVLLLWFHGLTRVVAPLGSSRRPRRPAPVSVRAPEHDAAWAHWIIREPPIDELSREWPQAWAARERLWQTRAPGGEALPPG